MTPWLATGVGILVAATLALNSPAHAVLSYGPIDPGTLCQTASCGTATPQRGPGSLTTVKPGIQLAPARSRVKPGIQPAPATTRHALADAGRARPKITAPPASAITVQFRVLRSGHRGFLAVITVHSPQKLSDWSLGFAIPGARISRVWGANWQPSSSGDGGVADGQAWPWPRSAASMARIVLFATGMPGVPTGCVFDGASCVFS